MTLTLEAPIPDTLPTHIHPNVSFTVRIQLPPHHFTLDSESNSLIGSHARQQLKALFDPTLDHPSHSSSRSTSSCASTQSDPEMKRMEELLYSNVTLPSQSPFSLIPLEDRELQLIPCLSVSSHMLGLTGQPRCVSSLSVTRTWMHRCLHYIETSLVVWLACSGSLSGSA